jgi:S-adenosyl-L-methionine hydrolase (adenosine-forming)
MIITLTTDFGLSDPFVGIMKGVILGIAPKAQLVDISHDIASYDVVEAAFLIESAYSYFPQGTVHVLVVDPGVGSERRPMAAVAHGHRFVGPDNGVFSNVLQNEAYHITNKSLFLQSVSRTFHGRDIFAPVAAHLAGGLPIDAVGPRIADFVKRPFPTPVRKGNKIIGTVLRIDKFGNIITNLRRSDLGREFSIVVAGVRIRRLCATFSETEPGEFFAVEGSTGYIELALNQSSAAERLKARRGAEIEVESGTTNK